MDENAKYPASNVLVDQCKSDGLDEWRGVGNSSRLVLVLGCKQDIKAFFIKNGKLDHQIQNFTISVGTHSKGPWKVALQGSFNITSPLVVMRLLG